MLKWSKRSLEKLETVQPELQRVVTAALNYNVMDMMVLEGRRSRERQNQLFDEGKSRVKWPNGKHNVTYFKDLARAVDVAPYIDGVLSWNKLHCCVMAGLILAAAKTLDVDIRWGGNWDRDYEPITDQDFQDLVHFELVQ